MILTFDKTGIVYNSLRTVLGGVDYIIYSIISWILEGIFNLSKLTTNSTFSSLIYKRIYVVLAIFMVFKLTVSFLQYLVNPDAFLDKDKGVGKLIGRTVTMLALLIFIPILFFETMPGKEEGETVLNVLQRGVINTIPKIVLGVSDENITNDDTQDDVSKKAKNMGVGMSLKMLETFYYPRDCGVSDEDNSSEGSDSSSTCITGLSSLDSFQDTIIDKGTDGYYKYRYMWPLTTVVGIAFVVILIGFAIDVAIRVFKLIILQMIAPIPIMSYIDPKSSKDGAFSSWLKSFVMTYVDVFIKLAIIYLLLLLFQQLFDEGFFSGGKVFMESTYGASAKSFVKVFLVIGLFKFAKDAPKFIKDALGIKDKGGGGGFVGKMASGLAGGAAGFAGGLMSGGLSGGLVGMAQGASGAYNASGTGKPYNAFGSARDSILQLRTGNKNARGGAMGRIERFGNRRIAASMGVDNDTLKVSEDNMLAAQAVAENADDIYSRFKDGTVSDAELRAWAAANGSTYNQARGTMTDSSGITKTVRKALHDDLNAKQTAASKAKSNYERGKKIGDTFGIGHDMNIKNSSSVVSRARRGIYNARQNSRIGTAQNIIDRSNNAGGWVPTGDRNSPGTANASNTDRFK